MGRFTGMTVVVTGAGRGQGRAIATRFAAEGANLGICDVGAGVAAGTEYALSSDDDLAATTKELEAAGASVCARPCDVRDSAQVGAFVAAVVDELGAPNVLVNNAGIVQPSVPVHETTDDLYDNVVAVNLGGVFRMSRAVVPHMLQNGGGRIVNIASTTGLRAAATFAVYSASKHAVIGLTRAMAGELAEGGITVNAVCPGGVVTKMVEHNAATLARETGVPFEEALQSFLGYHLIKEFVTPEQTASAVLFLADPEQRTVTGVAFPVDAGWTA
jgi:NAD(P)-dependent dehydrogenase (short-subunit alcohol dehydrogenase family)